MARCLSSIAVAALRPQGAKSCPRAFLSIKANPAPEVFWPCAGLRCEEMWWRTAHENCSLVGIGVCGRCAGAAREQCERGYAVAHLVDPGREQRERGRAGNPRRARAPAGPGSAPLPRGAARGDPGCDLSDIGLKDSTHAAPRSRDAAGSPRRQQGRAAARRSSCAVSSPGRFDRGPRPPGGDLRPQRGHAGDATHAPSSRAYRVRGSPGVVPRLRSFAAKDQKVCFKFILFLVP